MDLNVEFAMCLTEEIYIYAFVLIFHKCFYGLLKPFWNETIVGKRLPNMLLAYGSLIAYFHRVIRPMNSAWKETLHLLYRTCKASSAENKSFCDVPKYVINTTPHCPNLMKFMDELPKQLKLMSTKITVILNLKR